MIPFHFSHLKLNMDFSRMLVIRCLKTLLIFPLAWIKQLLPILHTNLESMQHQRKKLLEIYVATKFILLLLLLGRHKREFKFLCIHWVTMYHYQSSLCINVTKCAHVNIPLRVHHTSIETALWSPLHRIIILALETITTFQNLQRHLLLYDWSTLHCLMHMKRVILYYQDDAIRFGYSLRHGTIFKSFQH